MARIDVVAAQAQLLHLIDRVVSGEPVVITRDGHDVAILAAAHESAAATADVIRALREARNGVRAGRAGARSMADAGKR